MNLDGLLDLWWLFILAIPLFLLYLRLKSNKTYAGLSLKDLSLVVEFGIYGLLIFLVQKYMFSDHAYFILALPFFLVLFSVIIHLLLSGHDVYIIETAQEGDKYYSLDDNKEVVVDSTQHRIIKMDKEVYESKRHIGELHNQFWNGSPRIKFTNYYDDSIGVFFHPKLFQFHHFNFHAFRGFWEKMCIDVPALIDQNTILTFMKEYELSFKMAGMVDNLELYLKSMKNQHSHIPFKMPESLEQIYKRRAAETQRTPGEHEATQPQLAPKEPEKDTGGSD